MVNISVFGDNQCDNVGIKRSYNVAECKEKCHITNRCTAFNYNIGGGCVLRACTIPVTSPNWDHPNHEGYYLSAGST